MNRSNADHDVKSIFQKFPTVNVVLMTRNRKFSNNRNKHTHK